MRFACLGYYDEKAWEAMPEAEREPLVQQCFAYDEILKKNGNYVDGLALQGAATASTVRWGKGRASVTDGPFAETKEILGGILILEARDRAHALEIMSKHPGARFGPFEIRAVDEEMTARAKAR